MRNDISGIIDSIADKIGVAANLIVPEYAKMEIATGIVMMIICAIIMIAIAIALHLFFTKIADSDAESLFCDLLIGSVLEAIPFSIFCYGFYKTAIWYASPIGAMTKEILSALTNH